MLMITDGSQYDDDYLKSLLMLMKLIKLNGTAISLDPSLKLAFLASIWIEI